jgi:hypothetical protein
MKSNESSETSVAVKRRLHTVIYNVGCFHNSFVSTCVNKLTRIKDCDLVGHVACIGKMKDTDKSVTGGTVEEIVKHRWIRLKWILRK